MKLYIKPRLTMPAAFVGPRQVGAVGGCMSRCVIVNARSNKLSLSCLSIQTNPRDRALVPIRHSLVGRPFLGGLSTEVAVCMNDSALHHQNWL